VESDCGTTSIRLFPYLFKTEVCRESLALKIGHAVQEWRICQKPYYLNMIIMPLPITVIMPEPLEVVVVSADGSNAK